MKTAVRDAWAFGAELSLYDTIAPFSAKAVEQSAVDVSMSMILSIAVYFVSVSMSLRYGNTSNASFFRGG